MLALRLWRARQCCSGCLLRPISSSSQTPQPAAAAGRAQSPKTGVLMLNMGGPETLDDVGDFLLRLFGDPDLIPLPAQGQLSKYIAKRRTPHVKEQYYKIGGGSPILRWTEAQGRAMSLELDRLSPGTGPHRHYVGFRYARPLLEDAVEAMERDGVQHAVAFSQYPQYSCSTSGSSLNALAAHYRRRQGAPTAIRRWTLIDRWPAHAGFVAAVTERVRAELQRLGPEVRARSALLFSAHSLPMSVVNRGDLYPAEVAVSAHAVSQALGDCGLPYRVVWQSKVGPMPWLGPTTEEAIRGLARQGRDHLVLVPIAFTSDHIETLYELDVEYAGHLAEKVGAKVLRTEALNDSPTFVSALADLVLRHLAGGGAPSDQFAMRCPVCTNPRCLAARDFFAARGCAKDT